ncbi:receptor-type tyrosine-protein phosphatase alpha-like isoform X2 [Ptychodera flava]|uniref:receptor-type tyrosine-protein phosphatase alpha-like isoform X2 n=1 Tax=Ptychodera flava TaxID=63121 RepID=UPI00396A9F6F
MGIRFLALTVCLIVIFVPGALSVEEYFVNSPVTLDCDIAVEVSDTVVWKKNGTEVSYNGNSIVNQSLVFESVQLSDSGIYQCSVNKGNNITQGDNITLHVIDKLNPPLNLTVSDIRSDQVTISWTSGNHQDLVNQYNIEQKSGSGNESEWTDSSPQRITKNVADNSSSCLQCETDNYLSVVVKDLHPDTDYMFRVQAVPKSGEGSDFSQETRLITTLSRVLLRAPLDFRAKDVTDSRMTLKWKAPNGTDLPAIDGYRLYVVPSANPNITLRREQTKYNLTNLDAAKNYSLTLVALYGEHGEGEAISLNQSTDSKAPGVPRSIKVVYMSPSTAVVLWAAPTRKYNKVDAYTMAYRETAVSDYWFESSVPGFSTYSQLKNLKYGVSYEVTVQAITYSTVYRGTAYKGPVSTPHQFYQVPQGLEPKETSAPTTALSFTFTSLTSKKMLGATQISDIVANDDALVTTAAIIGTLLAIGIVVLGALVFFKYRKTRQSNHYYTRADSSPVQPSLEIGLPDLKTVLATQSIAKEDFEKHVMALHADSDHGFSVEYEDIRKISTKHLSCLHSKLPENKNKNRYLDIVAYDQSRVQLTPLSSKQKHTDYINANYVDGYHKPKAFIASQGPLKSTVNDFWRMIWEQNSIIIIMLTNLVEKGKKKCEQYWPSEGTEQYGSIEVTLEDTNNLAAYTIRRFTVKNCKAKKVRGQHGERMVYQYHYTAWPDHGIPEDSLPVISFVKKSSAANPPDAGPIIVHCSAGVGRTGTYIVIDTMLKQIQDTDRINVVAFMKHIRQQRNYLVQTEIQYTFLHDALLEAIRCGDTDINLDNYKNYLDQLEQEILVPNEVEISRLEKQLMRINKYSPKEYELQSALRPYNKVKNRSLDMLPVERSRVKLVPKPAEDGSDYINGSFLQGYRSNQEYIITQHPMQSTVVDFWRMIWDQNSETIVSLTSMESMEDGDLVTYWPTVDNLNFDCSNFTVTLKTEEHHLNMITRDFLLQSSQDDYMMNVRQFQYGYWPESCTPDTIFELIITVQKWKQQFEGPVTVHDKFGGCTAATFCALSTLNQQLRNEDIINVYEIAMLYNLRRPGIFPTKADYLFLFTAMKTAIDNRHKDRKLGSGRAHLPSHNGSSQKRHGSNAVDSIRRAFSLHEDHRPQVSSNNIARSRSFTSEPGSPKGNSYKLKKRSSALQRAKIAEEEVNAATDDDELTTLANSDGDIAVKWTKQPDGALTPKKDSDNRKLSNNNSSASDYRESGFEEDDVFQEV